MDRRWNVMMGLSALGLVVVPILGGCNSGSSGDAGASDVGTGGTTSEGTASTTAGTGDGSGDGTGDTTAGSTECSTETPVGLMNCVDPVAYQADLVTAAVDREPGSANWQMVQDLCAERLAQLGFTVETVPYATGVNVVGTLPGTSEAGTEILVAAHYDHIAGCTGADDNATGVAGTLEVARVLSQRSWARTLKVACWDEEERGLLGAVAYAQAADARGDDLAVYFNFEMIGYYDETPDSQTIPTGLDLVFPLQYQEIADRGFPADWIGYIGDDLAGDYVDSLERYGDSVGLQTIGIKVASDVKNSDLFRDLRRSDHAAFWAVDIPAIMITDTSEFRYDAYHCRNDMEDSVDMLNQEFSVGVIQSVVGAAAEALEGTTPSGG